MFLNPIVFLVAKMNKIFKLITYLYGYTYNYYKIINGRVWILVHNTTYTYSNTLQKLKNSSEKSGFKFNVYNYINNSQLGVKK